MNEERRALIEPIFNALDPEELGVSVFPPIKDDGNGDGSDADLASIIYYGSMGEIVEHQILFAIMLGRLLQKAGIPDL